MASAQDTVEALREELVHLKMREREIKALISLEEDAANSNAEQKRIEEVVTPLFIHLRVSGVNVPLFREEKYSHRHVFSSKKWNTVSNIGALAIAAGVLDDDKLFAITVCCRHIFVGGLPPHQGEICGPPEFHEQAQLLLLKKVCAEAIMNLPHEELAEFRMCCGEESVPEERKKFKGRLSFTSSSKKIDTSMVGYTDGVWIPEKILTYLALVVTDVDTFIELDWGCPMGGCESCFSRDKNEREVSYNGEDDE